MYGPRQVAQKTDGNVVFVAQEREIGWLID